MKITIKKVAQKCPVCEGRKVEVVKQPAEGFRYFMDIPCSVCNGEGVLWSEERIEESEVEKYMPKRGEYISVKSKSGYNWLSIFDQVEQTEYASYCDYCVNDNELTFRDSGRLCFISSILEQRPCTPEEIKQLDEALAKKGKRFDKEKMELVDIFKDGDIVYYPNTDLYVNNIRIYSTTNVYYIVYRIDNDRLYLDNTFIASKRDDGKLATEEQKQFLFSKLAEKGKRWNAEKKVIEDLPKEPIIGRPAIMWNYDKKDAEITTCLSNNNSEFPHEGINRYYKNAILCESLDQYLEFIKE